MDKNEIVNKVISRVEILKQSLLKKDGPGVDKRCDTWMLYYEDAREMIENTYTCVLSSLERRSTTTAAIIPIGRVLASMICNNPDHDYQVDAQDPVLCTKLGWFIFEAYDAAGILDIVKERRIKNGKTEQHLTYYITVSDTEAIHAMSGAMVEMNDGLFPVKTPPLDWQEHNFTHRDHNTPIIKNAHEDVVREFKNIDTSLLTRVLNKLQNTGWRINPYMFEVMENTKGLAYSQYKVSRETRPDVLASLLLEIEGIYSLAKANLGVPAIFHKYNADFRGRLYVALTKFLHEQSSDAAKGLLTFAIDEPLGPNGYKWLCVHIANCYGNDKVSINDRVKFVIENLDTFIDYAKNYLTSTNWMDVDKPNMFLAACNELCKIEEWKDRGLDIKDYVCSLPIYIDGSNNGIQHLVATSKDDKIAPYVNLVDQSLPGDIYSYVAEAVWKEINLEARYLPQETHNQYNNLVTALSLAYDKLDKAAPKSPRHKEAFKELRELQNKHYDLIKNAPSLYWSDITDKKTRRKIVKRNVMTMPYGGTRYGFGEQVYEDTKSMGQYFRIMQRKWSQYLGQKVYDFCYSNLDGPAKMLKLFEKVAVRENEKKRFMKYNQLLTNLPVTHPYKKPKVTIVQLYRRSTNEHIRLKVESWKESVLNPKKQKSGAAPNIVHSLDALHLTMTVDAAPYQVSVVHDSFGCTPGNMEHLYVLVRETFAKMYDMDPLGHILDQLDCTDLYTPVGDYDVWDICDAEYAFA